MNRQNKVILLVLLLAFGIMACAGPQTNVKKVDPLVASAVAYGQALQEYVNAGATYKMWFEAAPPEIQAEWRETISPVFKDAKDALDMWQMFIEEGQLPDDATVEDWKRLKTKMLIKMYEVGIVKKKEE